MVIHKALVTGGCGFIGSHVVDELVRRGSHVTVLDNLTTGYEFHLDAARTTGRVELVRADILDQAAVYSAMKDVDTVFHFAANADVRGGMKNTSIDLEQNVIATQRVLEACRAAGVTTFVLASSATVYGDAPVVPTNEDCPKVQTSLYGASKLAAEAMAEAFSEYFGIRTIALRFVSWIGERYSHGVLFDFVKKLQHDPTRLQILGNGRQRKSFLHVDDGIRGIFAAVDNTEAKKAVYNIGHAYTLDVDQIAAIVIREMKLSDVTLEHGSGDRGWLGDSPLVHLDTAKLEQLGWSPRVSIEDGVARTVRYLLSNPWLLESRQR